MRCKQIDTCNLFVRIKSVKLIIIKGGIEKMKNESIWCFIMTPVYIKNADSFSFYKKEKKNYLGREREEKKKRQRERERARIKHKR